MMGEIGKMKTASLHLPDNTATLVANDARTILVPIRGIDFSVYVYAIMNEDGQFILTNGSFERKIKPPCKVGDLVRLKETWGSVISG